MIVLEVPPVHVLLHVLVVVDELHFGHFGDFFILLVNGVVGKSLDLMLFGVVFL
jgi:hypothetical protein